MRRLSVSKLIAALSIMVTPAVSVTTAHTGRHPTGSRYTEHYPNTNAIEINYATTFQRAVLFAKWSPNIHERIIREALKDRLSGADIEIVVHASNECDNGANSHSPACAHLHAMRAPDQDSACAHEKAASLFWDRVRKFQENYNGAGPQYLGEALHIFTDATSPMHRGFQEWHGTGDLPALIRALVHVQGETRISDKLFDYIVAKVRAFYDAIAPGMCSGCWAARAAGTAAY